MADLDNTVSTKVADTTLERIEDYADEHGMVRSEAIRNRLRAGLELDAGIPGAHVSYGFIAGAFGIAFLSAGLASTASALTYLGVGLLLAAVAHDGPYWLGLRGGDS